MWQPGGRPFGQAVSPRGACVLILKTQCFLFTGAWECTVTTLTEDLHNKNLSLVAPKKKDANGLRHPSKKEAQGSKSSKP